MKKLISSFLISLPLLSLSTHTVAEDQVKKVSVGRYSVSKVEPRQEQKKLLGVVTTIRFSENIKTVGDAINYLLTRPGYRLAPLSNSDPKLPILLNSPLPEIHRSFENSSVSQILKTLSTDVWELINDPVHRYVSFELSDQYRAKPDHVDETESLALVKEVSN